LRGRLEKEASRDELPIKLQCSFRMSVLKDVTTPGVEQVAYAGKDRVGHVEMTSIGDWHSSIRNKSISRKTESVFVASCSAESAKTCHVTRLHVVVHIDITTAVND
jgi:hypothetical protein